VGYSQYQSGPRWLLEETAKKKTTRFVTAEVEKAVLIEGIGIELTFKPGKIEETLLPAPAEEKLSINFSTVSAQQLQSELSCFLPWFREVAASVTELKDLAETRAMLAPDLAAGAKPAVWCTLRHLLRAVLLSPYHFSCLVFSWKCKTLCHTFRAYQ